MFRTAMATLCLGFAIPVSLAAQGAPMIPTQATHEEITNWLRGSDQRWVALGAYFAARNRDVSAVPQLTLLAESWQSLPPQEMDANGSYIRRSPEQIERSNAMTQVLDALIQLRGTVTAHAIEEISRDFLAQALTLFAMMPEPQRAEFAKAVYKTRRGVGATYNWHEMAHDEMVYVAAAILAEHPPAGFTASLLNEATVVLNLGVRDDRKTATGLFPGGACYDSFALGRDPGWPQPWTYVVERKWPQQLTDDLTVLVPGNPAITTRRAITNSSCSALGWFSSAVRLRLAEQEAGLPAGGPMRELRYDNLAYPGPGGYQKAVLAVVTLHAEEFRRLAMSLQEAGFLNSKEARTVGPRFIIRVIDERADRAIALPKLDSKTPKVVFASSTNAEGTPF